MTPWADCRWRTKDYRKWRNWTWGATKMVSTPPYSPHGHSDLVKLGIVWKLAPIEVASPTRFLNFNPGPEQWAPKVGGSAPLRSKNPKKIFLIFDFFFCRNVIVDVLFNRKTHPLVWIYNFSPKMLHFPKYGQFLMFATSYCNHGRNARCFSLLQGNPFLCLINTIFHGNF